MNTLMINYMIVKLFVESNNVSDNLNVELKSAFEGIERKRKTNKLIEDDILSNTKKLNL